MMPEEGFDPGPDDDDGPSWDCDGCYEDLGNYEGEDQDEE